MTKRYPLKQAMVTGIISAVFATFSFSIANGLREHFDWPVNPATIRWAIGLLTLIILGIGIYVAMQSIKKANGGSLSYSRALGAGIMVAATVAILMAALGFIYTQYINPGYANYMVNEGIKAMLADGKSPAEIAEATAGLQKQFSPATQLMQALVGQTVMGAIFSLILGVFIRTKKQNPAK